MKGKSLWRMQFYYMFYNIYVAYVTNNPLWIFETSSYQKLEVNGYAQISAFKSCS